MHLAWTLMSKESMDHYSSTHSMLPAALGRQFVGPPIRHRSLFVGRCAHYRPTLCDAILIY